jgi:hypothetical protein
LLLTFLARKKSDKKLKADLAQEKLCMDIIINYVGDLIVKKVREGCSELKNSVDQYQFERVTLKHILIIMQDFRNFTNDDDIIQKSINR